MWNNIDKARKRIQGIVILTPKNMKYGGRRLFKKVSLA